AGEIHAHDQVAVRERVLLPLPQLFASIPQYTQTNGQDQSSLFRERDEVVRRDKLALGMLPANERFEAVQLATRKRDDRLVINTQFILLERAPQIALKAQEGDGACVHRGIKDLAARFATIFR